MSTDLPVLGKAMRDQRRGLLMWALGIAIVMAIYTSSYAQVKEQGDALDSIPSGMAGAMNFQDLTSGAGFLEGTVFGLLGPLLLLIFAISTGTRAIAAQEQSGVLDLYLAYPISRRRLGLERFGALVAALLAFTLLIALEVTGLSSSQDMDVPAGNIVAGAVQLGLLALFFGALALCIGGITGSRPVTLGATSAAAVGTYVLNAIASQIDGLHFLQRLTPFYWAQGTHPLREGFSLGGVLVLLAATAVVLAVGMRSFSRRDINS
ncbi:ABC transporter permease subunit [Streptomyces sp. S3(2020)]|uniref:ABC transporter permease subunit n=1 Tax=Streptomyces sp. S3(2020) TaxID=2732044 RepID=UPI001488CC65|nr:ABC transporter permease subunit [Streptomyces sp. S3(2020)]NNN29660.1 ABC transporter permease subunit [Streptomyces sp. S3(2020)]